MLTATDHQVGRLARAANIILLGAMAATATIAAGPRVAAAIGWRGAPALAYAPGSTVDTPAAWHEQQDFTLIVFARSSCSACQSAQPFLKRLASDLVGRAAVVLVTTGKEQDADARFARSLGLETQAVKVAPAGLRVRATPTLVLVNGHGQVLGSWEGVGSVDKQADIVRSIDRTVGTTRSPVSGGPARPGRK